MHSIGFRLNGDVNIIHGQLAILVLLALVKTDLTKPFKAVLLLCFKTANRKHTLRFW